MEAATENVPSTAHHTLRIKNIPSMLSEEAVKLLFSHYGAASVRILKRTKPGAALGTGAIHRTQVAIAEFTSQRQRNEAQARLQRVQLGDGALICEPLEPATDTSTAQIVSVATPQALHDSVALTTASSGDHTSHSSVPSRRHRTPAPLAPHLGLHYALSPLLQYKYPKATAPIVTNIANALMALPRFYTQVLHLMNKMNLPTPFQDGAIPGVFSDMAARREPVNTSTNDSIVENEEEQDDEEDGDDTATLQTTITVQSGLVAVVAPSKIGRKRKRSASQLCVASSAFHEDESRLGARPPRPGVISLVELQRQRLPATELARDVLFLNYEPGYPSLTVSIRNLADSVDAKDLEYVFGHFLPLDAPLASLAIAIESTSSIATLRFPSTQAATQAVESANGVVLDGQPLLVRFHCEPQEEEEAEQPPMAAVPEEMMDPTRLSVEKAMKNYVRGEPTPALYLKNLARTVDAATLRSLCLQLLPDPSRIDALSIRHFAEGRMKNQAFVEFPTVALATLAIDRLHGRVVDGKPIVALPQVDTVRLDPHTGRYVATDFESLMLLSSYLTVFSIFASVVAPFGGFHASAIKRTYHIKDFDSLIPGHGGVMDRMDCQFITALFTSVYYNTFIRSQTPSLAMILHLVAKLSPTEQRELIQRLQEISGLN